MSRFILCNLLMISLNGHAKSFPLGSYANLATAKVEQLSGQDIKSVTVVFFWASWCNFCKEFAREMSSLPRGFRKSVAWIAINADADRNAGLQALAPYGFSQRYLWMSADEASQVPELSKLPLVYIISAQGKVDTIYQGANRDKMNYFKKRLQFLRAEKENVL